MRLVAGNWSGRFRQIGRKKEEAPSAQHQNKKRCRLDATTRVIKKGEKEAMP